MALQLLLAIINNQGIINFMSKYENYTKEQLIAKIATLESKKNYGLVWDDEKEPENVVLECQNNIPILKKIEDKTIHTDTNKPNNILIEGDNYHALQVLNYTHKGQIDVIYIDPPYNTGNKDFKYNDSFVDKEDGYRHSKWLNFMSKRLKLAHNLLKNDGVIFISIDDNEVYNLKLLCDNIFDRSNFIVNLPTIMNLKGNNDQFGFAGTHEFTLVYSKNIVEAKINLFEVDEEEIISKWDEDEYGFYKQGANLKATGVDGAREKRPNLFFPIFINEFNEVYVTNNNQALNQNDKMILPISDGNDMRWRWSKNKIKNELHNIVVIGDSLYKKQRPDLGDLPSKKPKSIFYKPEYSSGNGTTLLKDLFNDKVFNNPKPLVLIKDLIFLGSQNNSIILDFFAGSGTTGHAILDLNQDGGNRQFILCTNNENDICTDVTYPRLSKAINGYTTPKGVAVGGLGGNLDYYKTDLVPTDGIANISDSTREELTKKAGNMIAIKENTHAMIELNEHYQIFKNETSSKQTAIYFTEDLSHFDELVEKTKGHKTKLYIFSFGKIDKSSYKYLGKTFEIEDIPEPIIEIYKEINKEGIL